LDDGNEHTLEEVGQSFAVTRERIRQIEGKALRKLRHPSRSHKLRTFLGPPREINSRPLVRSKLEKRDSNLKEAKLMLDWERPSNDKNGSWRGNRPGLSER